MSKRIRVLVFVGVLMVLIAIPIRTAAQSGANLDIFQFTPDSNQQIPNSVDIHIKWTCSPNCGEATVTVSCGGGDQIKNTFGDFHFHWDTNGCQAGQQSVTVSVRSNDDPQGIHASRQTKNYILTGGNPNAPTVQFSADSYNVPQDGGTTIHWKTTNATSVNIDGDIYGPNGDLYVHPIHATRKFSIAATGPGGTTYANFQVTVSDQPAQPQPTPVPPQPTSAGNSGEEPGIGSDGKPFDRNVPFRRDIPSLAQARQYGTGGVEVSIYCAAMGKGVPTHDPDGSPNSAYSWFCPPDMPLTDFMKVCYNVWGNHYVSQNAMDANHIGGWRCLQNGGGSNPNPPVDNRALATGSDSVLSTPYIYVAAETYDLNLRDGPGTNFSIKGKVNPNQYYSVLDLTNSDWVKIQTSLGEGWVYRQYVQVVSDQDQATPTPQPTLLVSGIQVTGENQEKDYSHADPNCGELGYKLPSGGGIYAADAPPQCTDHVYGIYPKLIDCWKKRDWIYSNADQWDDWARDAVKKCNLSINPPTEVSTSNPANPNDIRIGDIVVWEKSPDNTSKHSCGYAWSEKWNVGHVAVLKSLSGNMMTLDEANWSRPDPRPYNLTCMSFIHVPPELGGPSSNGKAVNTNTISSTGVTWSFCVGCISNAWLTFSLPKGHYDISNYKLTFNKVANVVVQDVSVTSNDSLTDTVTLYVSTSEITNLVNDGYGGTLNDLSNWELHYTVK